MIHNFLSFYIVVGKCEEWKEAVIESRDLVSVSRRVSRPVFGVSVSKVSGLVSVSKDFGLGLELFVSRLCICHFYEVLQQGVP